MRPPVLPHFTRSELIFSLKCFAAALIAMTLASRAGLPRPFWALMTTYIVANPLAGAVRSKATYRLLGTLLGCAATLVLVPWLFNAPWLLAAALALWTAACLYFSLLDRTPRAYVFMLAGYTAALIGFPSVDAPAQLFDTALARVEEVTLGILVATAVHALVLPTGLAPQLLRLVDRALDDARRWLDELLAGAAGALASDRRGMAADLTQLRLLSTHLPFDTMHLRWSADAVHALQERMAALLPALSAVEDRLQALREAEAAPAPDVNRFLAQLRRWLHETDAAAAAAQLPALRAALHALATPEAASTPWARALRINLALGLEALMQRWRGCVLLRRRIDRGLAEGGTPRLAPSSLRGEAFHRDAGLAALSALTAAVAVFLCCVFWLATAWPAGAGAASFAAIMCSLFATRDDPVPAIHGFLKYTLWSVPVSALYVLVLLPLVQDMPTFAVLSAPALLLIGACLSRPALAAKAMPVFFGVVGTLALHDTARADVAGFANATLAQLAGMGVAAGTTALMRSIPADWSARRLQRANWRDLELLAAMPGTPARDRACAVRMLDRIGLLAPRLAQLGGRVEGVVAGALHDLRLGADVIALQRARPALPPAAGTLLRELALGFRARRTGAAAGHAPGLLRRLDRLLAELLADDLVEGPAVPPAAVAALVGLRRNLFPEATPLRAVSLEAGA